MVHHKYLIVGGGMTADAAVRGIREVDADGSIGLIGAEQDAPYNRPPLSKSLWKGAPIDSIWRQTDTLGVELYLGRRVQSLDPGNRCVTDDSGAVYSFDKLLLATGASPRRLPFGDDHIVYYRTFRDYERVRDLAGQGKRFAVVGGGFIGSEIAAALAMNGKEVFMIFRGESIGASIFPADLARFLNDYYREKSVQVLAGQSLVGVERRDGGMVVKTSGGQEYRVDGVVAGLGVRPNVELAEAAGLEVSNGIVVDEWLRTTHPDIYAAGDVANFYSPTLEMRRRVEHEDNANTMGRTAGRAMAGRAEPYHYIPFFYSDLFDLGYEALGELDSHLEMVADWKEPHREGVVYYLRDGRVRGVLLWNVWKQKKAARLLLAEPGPFRAEDLKGRLPRGQ